MLNDQYFYNATIRKTVAVFGTLFNNIYTGKTVSGKLTQTARVPISYGPRERFLVRLENADNVNDADVAVKLPRMSFEMTSISYDAASALNRNNVRTFPVEGNNDSRIVVRQAVPYIIGMQLSILTDNQDTGLQIVEQILPNFQPEYTLAVKDMEGPGTKTDVPIVLNGVTLSDDYEGDFEASRRQIIYTLDFTIKVKFVGSIVKTKKIIKDISVNLSTGSPCNPDTTPDDRVRVQLGDPVNDTPDDFTVVTTYGFDD